MGWYSRVSTRRKSRSPLPPRRSAPLQKPRPAPVSTTALVPSSRDAAFNAARSSRRMVAFRALRASGRFSVIVVTLASVETRRVSGVWSGIAPDCTGGRPSISVRA